MKTRIAKKVILQSFSGRMPRGSTYQRAMKRAPEFADAILNIVGGFLACCSRRHWGEMTDAERFNAAIAWRIQQGRPVNKKLRMAS